MTKIEEIEQLLEQFYAGETTREQELHLHQLMKETGNSLPEHLKADAEMIAALCSATSARAVPEGWDAKMSSMIQQIAAKEPAPTVKRGFRLGLAAIASAAVAAAIIFAVIWHPATDEQRPSSAQQLASTEQHSDYISDPSPATTSAPSAENLTAEASPAEAIPEVTHDKNIIHKRAPKAIEPLADNAPQLEPDEVTDSVAARYLIQQTAQLLAKAQTSGENAIAAADKSTESLNKILKSLNMTIQ